MPLLDSMPFYGDTTHRADYTRKQARSQSARPPERPLPSNPFEGDTTYRAQFPPKRADPGVPAKAPAAPWSAPFVGVTTYNTEYIPRKVRPWTAQPERQPPTAPWEGTSEYRDNYTKKPLAAHEARAAAPLLPSSHVATITTYGHDYVPLPFEKRERLVCCDDPRHPPDYPPPCTWHGPGTGAATGKGLQRSGKGGGGGAGARSGGASQAGTRSVGFRPGSAPLAGTGKGTGTGSGARRAW
ncbi:hypothetical protein GPECTOR_11g80 [Gonium pectorale]|uniref:Uncharacterized protein n=1 Tax=Gonium pectorale TaxID=33097 RepID=A0A150GQ39_GONPE|nr:hypothetical protein GPECTOR_11g80 [Gonium pectorale]|eukprot:KXZ51957.1 hypothetical protein GPECTOR_11g80 [Gonium pectorale]